MIRRGTAVTLIVGLLCAGAAATVAAQNAARGAVITGIAKAADQRPLTDHSVRLRSLDSGRLVATTRTDSTGEYTFRRVAAGRYAVEVANTSEKIVATAGPFVITGAAERQPARIVLPAAAVGSVAAVGIAALFQGDAGAVFRGSAPDVTSAAAVAGIDGATVNSHRPVPSSPR